MERRHVANLERRAAHLAERLENWGRGDQQRTRAELASIRWALRVVESAETEGVLRDFAGRARRGT